jgi:hypothetical protein
MRRIRHHLTYANVMVTVLAFVVLGGATALGATVFTAVGIEDIQVKTSTTSFSTQSASYVNVPGAYATLTVSSDRAIRARFSAESQCNKGGGSVGDQCQVRIMVSPGGELNPASAEGFAFDSYDGNSGANAAREAQSMERISNGLTAGTYTVRVQARTQGGVAFTLDDWTLSAETLPRGIPPG